MSAPWRTWYTCRSCPPHGMSDHTLYGMRECLITGCPCKTYIPDLEKPEKKAKKPSIPPVNNN